MGGGKILSQDKRNTKRVIDPMVTSFSSLEVEIPSSRPQNPYGNGSQNGSASNARLYFMLCLIFFTIYGLFNMIGPGDSTGTAGSDASGGWGIEHNHAIEHHETTFVTAPHKDSTSSGYYAPYYPALNTKGYEFTEEDFMQALVPIVSVPSHARPEYDKYQKYEKELFDPADLLTDKNTPHGMAYDFIMNRDTRNLKPEDPQLIQRYVVTLLFYATGGHDDNDSVETLRGGWDSDMAHFLTGLHECHWVKKSLGDAFWELLSMEDGDDSKVGITRCNDEMEVTEIRLGKSITSFLSVIEYIVLILYVSS